MLRLSRFVPPSQAAFFALMAFCLAAPAAEPAGSEPASPKPDSAKPAPADAAGAKPAASGAGPAGPLEAKAGPAAPEAPVAAISVDSSKPGAKISNQLYGIFFEEINHAGDGGLYAELVRNRAFEDSASEAEGWKLVTSGTAKGEMTLDVEKPLNAANPRSLRVAFLEGEGSVGVENSGYWGMGLLPGGDYKLSLFARAAPGFTGPLLVRLEMTSGVVSKEVELRDLAPEWKRLTATLTCEKEFEPGSLVISLSRPGVVWLDVVSLFPRKTWLSRENGLRADLAQFLDDLRPEFVRFPGGCFVEGDQLQNAFRWKTTIGRIEERPGHWNLWGYRSTDGLGYHEYLQMCEDLGAHAMFVANCGMSHGGNVPLDELGPWVEDALHAVEYAIGPLSTKWGEMRARNGHIEGFPLRYVEIGNENGGPPYEERYARFYDALKARYPEVKLIANVPVRSRPMDILDEHYYSSVDWFVSNSTRYDTYDRKGPKIYVGEYAVTAGAGKGNLAAALGEAAFLCGVERNSDVVIMASYAPLFVNDNDRKWNPDLIVFDRTRAYGTPSYHLQRIFGFYRGQHVLPVKLTLPESRARAVAGGVGLGTWVTQAEFKDVRVERGGQVLLLSDFSKGCADWKPLRGDWKAFEGAYRQDDARSTDVRSTAGDPEWQEYTYTLKARKLSGAEGFLVMFGVRDDGNWYWWNIGGWGNSRHAIEKCSGGGKSELPGSVPGSLEAGRWYDLRIELAGARIRCYLDGALVHDVTDAGPPSLVATASLEPAYSMVYLKVVNVAGAPQRTSVRIDGTKKVWTQGEAIQLTSERLEDENSFEYPTKIIPQIQPMRGMAKEFEYTFPKYSVTFLRIKVDL